MDKDEAEAGEPDPGDIGDSGQPGAGDEGVRDDAPPRFFLSDALRSAGPHGPSAVSAFQRIAPQMEALVAEQMRPVLDAFRTTIPAQFAQQYLPWVEGVRELAKSLRIPRIKLDLPPNLFPPNWTSVLGTLDLDVIIGIVLGEGIPLVWVPRAHVISELIDAANPQARRDVLLAWRMAISEDCIAVIDEVTAEDLQPLARLAADAATALRDDYTSGAQALAANVFDTLIRDVADRGILFADNPLHDFTYGRFRRHIPALSDDTSIVWFRALCALGAAVPAMASNNRPAPPLTTFARHVTAHRAGPEQYTNVNAIIAVMVMASMLREAQESGW